MTVTGADSKTLIEAQNEIEELRSGDELVINFDCTQATESIPRWAASLISNKLVRLHGRLQ